MHELSIAMSIVEMAEEEAASQGASQVTAVHLRLGKLSGIVKEALNLADTTAALDVGGSQRAGTSGLIHALQGAAATGRQVLCVASDKRRARPSSEGELLNGDAAAAFLVGSGEPVATFLGSHSVTVDFVGKIDGTPFPNGAGNDVDVYSRPPLRAVA